MKKLLLLFLIPLFFGCKTTKTTVALNNSDSTTVSIVERILRDTTLIPADTSAWVQALIECDSNGQAVIKSLVNQLGQRSSAVVETTRSNTGSLITKTKCKCDSLSIYTEMKSHDTLSIRVVRKEIAVEVPAKLTWWEGTKMQWGGYFIGFDLLVLLLLLGWFAWKIFKNFTPQGAAVSTGFSLLGWFGKLFKKQ